MKTLELELNKRLLIVEGEEDKVVWDVPMDEKGCHPIKLICKGSELTEEIVKQLITYNEKTGLYDGFYFPMFAFVDAINELGFYWNETNRPEIKNFNPSKTLIFEIL